MISDIGSQPRSLWSETRSLYRAVRGNWSTQHSTALRRDFAIRTIKKSVFAIPEGVYRYTRLFLMVFACWIGQSVQSRQITRYFKYLTNREVILLSVASLENTVYQVGWAHPRAGLVLNSIHRLATRALLLPDSIQRRTIGYSGVESGKRFPIDLGAVKLMARAGALHVYAYARLVFKTVKNVVRVARGYPVPDSHWHGLIPHVGDLLHHKLDVARCELLMCSPGISQHILFGLMRVSERGFAELQKSLA